MKSLGFTFHPVITCFIACFITCFIACFIAYFSLLVFISTVL